MLHYELTGHGEPLVLIHGFCENNTCFDKQVLLLKEHCKLILPDLPGAGKSATIPNASIELMADQVAELLQHLSLEQANVIGHSMGGYVTLALVKKYPHLVKRFGLLHSTAKPDDESRKEKRDQAINVIQQKGASFYAKNFIPPLFKNNTSTQLIEPLLSEAEKSSEQGLTQALLAMKNRPDSMAVIEQTEKPTFWGIGMYDELIPAQIMLQQALKTQQPYIALFNQSAHMAHIEEPETLAAHLLRFIKS